MKKRLVTVLTSYVLAMCLMLSACGSTQETTAPVTESESTTESTTPEATTTTPEATTTTPEATTTTPEATTTTPEATTTTPEATTQSGANTEKETITITDMTGREINVQVPVERIVALSAADCEVLFAVGAGDMLAGRGEYCDYPAEVLEIPAVQSGMETNIEQIIALEPQVLLMSTMAQTEEQVAALEAAGIAVVVSDAQDIAGVYESIGIIGTLTGHEAEAEAVVENMKSQLAEVAAASTGDGTESVYFEVSPLEWGLWTAGKGTFMNEVAELLGLKNAFDDVNGWGEISEEQVLERNPDYIVTITMYFGEGPTPEEEIASRNGWDAIKAVQNGKILRLQNEELSRPAPRIADGAKLLFELVYGNEAP